MNDDQLSRELSRRAAAADAPDLLPALRSAIDTRPTPVGSSRLAPLVGLVGVVAALLLLVIALPTLTPGDAPVTVIDTDGDFSLSLTVPRTTYAAGDAIDLHATLTYDAEAESVSVMAGEFEHPVTGAAATRLIGFGLTEVDGTIEAYPSFMLTCQPISLHRDSPVREAFTTSVAFDPSDADALVHKALVMQQPLRLPPGTWRVWAAFGREICDTEGVDLRAELSITVSPQAVEIPPDTADVTVLAADEFAKEFRLGSLDGMTVLVAGEIDLASPLSRPCRPHTACHMGQLDGTDPPVDVLSLATPTTQQANAIEYDGQWWDRPHAPVEGTLLLSVDGDTVVYRGLRTSLDGTLSPRPASVESSDPSSMNVGDFLLVEGWLAGISEACQNDLDRVTVVPGLPQRFCGGASWIVHHPHGFSREGVRVQNGAYRQMMPDAPRPPTFGAELVEPVWGRWALAKRLEGWCGENEPPCWRWHVIGRLALYPHQEPSVSPDPTEAPEATPRNSTIDCPPVRESLGDVAPTVIDETGLVQRCLAATPTGGPPVSNPGGDQSVLHLEWSGSSCDAEATISLSGSAGSYDVRITPAAGFCRLLLAPYAIQLELSGQVAAEEVTVTHAEAPELGSAWWELAAHERPTAESTELDLVVHEVACASGQSPEGRIVGPEIVYDQTEVSIAFQIQPLPGAGDCPLAPGAPVTVQLAEPLGDRQLIDGSAAGDLVVEPSEGLLVLETGRADEFAHERFAAMVGGQECMSTVMYDRSVPTQEELEEAANELDGEEGFIESGGYVTDDWLSAARAFGAIEAYGGRLPLPWYIVMPGEPLTLATLDLFPISRGRAVWFAGFHQATIANPDCSPSRPTPDPAPESQTLQCSDAPAAPEPGPLSIEDHTGLVVGCEGETDRSVPTGELSVSLEGDTTLVVTWPVVLDNCAPMQSHLEFWSGPEAGLYALEIQMGDPNAAPNDPGGPMCDAATGVHTARLTMTKGIDPAHVDTLLTLVSPDSVHNTGFAQLGENWLELKIFASRSEYASGEAIDVWSSLTSDNDITVSCPWGPIVSMQQLDGPLTFTPGPFALMCPGPRELRSHEPVMRGFLPGAGYADPNPLEPYLRDGGLYLPSGTYRFTATTSFEFAETRSQLEASMIVTVR